jgi:hypothetical protein
MTRLSLAIVVCWASAAAQAAMVYSKGFEPPTFAVGNLDLQDGWNGHTHGVASLAKIQKSVVHGGTQAVMIDSAALSNSAWYEKHVDFDPVLLGMPIVTVDWWMRWDGVSASNAAIGLDVYGTDSKRVGYLQVNSSNKVKFNGVTTNTTITRGTWYDYKLVFNYTTNKYQGFVNGVSVASAAAMPNHHGFGDVDLARWGSTLNKCNDKAYFDDLSITTTPEPASLSLLALGALALLRRR